MVPAGPELQSGKYNKALDYKIEWDYISIYGRHAATVIPFEIKQMYFGKQSKVPKLRALNQNKFSFYLTMG